MDQDINLQAINVSLSGSVIRFVAGSSLQTMSFLLEFILSTIPVDVLCFTLIDLVESKLRAIVPLHQTETILSTSFPPFKHFANTVISASGALPASILGSVIYSERLRKQLVSPTYGTKETVYRIFVTSLIISSKFLIDGAPKNENWAQILSPWFKKSELKTMERQFLQFIDYKLAIKPHELEDIIISDNRLQTLRKYTQIPTLATKGFSSLSFVELPRDDEKDYTASTKATVTEPLTPDSIDHGDCGNQFDFPLYSPESPWNDFGMDMPMLRFNY